MIHKDEIRDFFDRCAPTWDAEMIRSDEKIRTILDNAEVGAHCRVLDVACGTGVLIPDYLSRAVASVTGIDLSGEMIKIAQSKFAGENVRFICGDVETAELDGGYDAIVIYNAFPHFPDPQRLIARLSALLAEGGRLTVAHGAGRETIDAHHHGAASHVSNGLMPASELAELFKRELDVTVVLSTDEIYQVVGKKRG